MLTNLFLIAVAWGSLLLPLPRWLFFSFSFVVLVVGALFVLFGAAFVYWDSHMQPGSRTALYALVTGILIVLSRAHWLMKGLADDP